MCKQILKKNVTKSHLDTYEGSLRLQGIQGQPTIFFLIT